MSALCWFCFLLVGCFLTLSNSPTLQSRTSESSCSLCGLLWLPPYHGHLQRSSKEGLKKCKSQRPATLKWTLLKEAVGKVCFSNSCELKVPHFSLVTISKEIAFLWLFNQQLSLSLFYIQGTIFFSPHYGNILIEINSFGYVCYNALKMILHHKLIISSLGGRQGQDDTCIWPEAKKASSGPDFLLPFTEPWGGACTAGAITVPWWAEEFRSFLKQQIQICTNGSFVE